VEVIILTFLQTVQNVKGLLHTYMTANLSLQLNSINLIEEHFGVVLLSVMGWYEAKPATRIKKVQTHFKEAMVIV
jgi:hypothetical protein